MNDFAFLYLYPSGGTGPRFRINQADIPAGKMTGAKNWRQIFPSSHTTVMCRQPPSTTSMSDIRPGGGLTIKQLLHTLREQLASNMFVGPHLVC